MATIQIRIDDKTKRSARKVLDRLGIDMSTAIKAYLRQVAIHERLPISLVTENGLTPEEEGEIVRADKEARAGKNVFGPFDSTDEMLKSLKD